MTINEIFTFVSSVLSVLFAGGALVTLFSIRATNEKTLAEAGKLKAEANQIKDAEKITAFESQVRATNLLTDTMTKRLDQLGNRLTDYENRDEAKEKKIDDQELLITAIKMDNQRIRRSFDTLNRIFNRLITILHNYFELRSNVLLNGGTEDPGAIEKLRRDIEDVENQYLEYERAWKEDTQQLN